MSRDIALAEGGGSIIQRKVLAPNDFHDLDTVADRLLARIDDHEPLAAAA